MTPPAALAEPPGFLLAASLAAMLTWIGYRLAVSATLDRAGLALTSVPGRC